MAFSDDNSIMTLTVQNGTYTFEKKGQIRITENQNVEIDDGINVKGIYAFVSSRQIIYIGSYGLGGNGDGNTIFDAWNNNNSYQANIDWIDNMRANTQIRNIDVYVLNLNGISLEKESFCQLPKTLHSSIDNIKDYQPKAPVRISMTDEQWGSFSSQFDNQNIDNRENSNSESDKEKKSHNNFQLQYSYMLSTSKNLILRGAPGTGKTYLAKQIAADLVSSGECTDYDKLDPEVKKQIEFVQFHPSYDYSDFVEGLRPAMNDDGSMGFSLEDGIFKKFVNRAKKNYENAHKSCDMIEKEKQVQALIDSFLVESVTSAKKYNLKKGNEFVIEEVIGDNIYISIPNNPTFKQQKLKISPLKNMLESTTDFKDPTAVKKFLGYRNSDSRASYYYSIYQVIKNFKINLNSEKNEKETLGDERKFVFIIDEINRGEISKIFGELFFAIDPGYRGKAGEISTQYSNMHDTDEKFYIPENVYIIGTMNDIDRSVDSFDFAMRRRFRFVEIKAKDQVCMLYDCLKKEEAEDAEKRMNALNRRISEVDELNDNYHVGPSYFLKLKDHSPEELWIHYIEPLLQEYVRGMHEINLIGQFKYAYDNPNENVNDNNAPAQN